MLPTYQAPLGNMVTMAPPPLVQNHAKTCQGWGRHWRKKYQRTAGVSAH
jgi:hypothetical protein